MGADHERCERHQANVQGKPATRIVRHGERNTVVSSPWHGQRCAASTAQTNAQTGSNGANVAEVAAPD